MHEGRAGEGGSTGTIGTTNITPTPSYLDGGICLCLCSRGQILPFSITAPAGSRIGPQVVPAQVQADQSGAAAQY